MDVVVFDRSAGKTTLLMDWLHAGTEISTYPGWSRVLVCAYDERVPRVTRDVKDRFGNGPWAKCVFSVGDLRSAFRGAIRPDTVEFAVDDVDALLWVYLRVPQGPALITLTGTTAYQ